MNIKILTNTRICRRRCLWSFYAPDHNSKLVDYIMHERLVEYPYREDLVQFVFHDIKELDCMLINY